MHESLGKQHKNYQVVEQLIHYLSDNAQQQPSLSELASLVNLSEFHLQRVFSEWAGISPKRFLQYLTKEHARNALADSLNVLSTTLKTGLSSPGRLHDLMISCEAMSPGEIKTKGLGVCLSYGVMNTPFGMALIAWSNRGITNLFFCSCGEEEVDQLTHEWPAATLVRDDEGAASLSKRIFRPTDKKEKLHLLLRGTNFQLKVWEALLGIGTSQLVSYSTLASMAKSPKAQRAVGTALASNKIGFLIPCHRVIKASGEMGAYRWGSERKLSMYVWEKKRQGSS